MMDLPLSCILIVDHISLTITRRIICFRHLSYTCCIRCVPRNIYIHFEYSLFFGLNDHWEVFNFENYFIGGFVPYNTHDQKKNKGMGAYFKFYLTIPTCTKFQKLHNTEFVIYLF